MAFYSFDTEELDFSVKGHVLEVRTFLNDLADAAEFSNCPVYASMFSEIAWRIGHDYES